MPARLRRSELGAARGRTIVGELMREARESRFGYGLSQNDVARAIGMSRSQYSRVERGLVPTVSLVTAAEMLAVIGLDLSVRTYPSGAPIRDAAHAALLERLRRLLHGSLRWRTEVPLPDPRERRAWDAVVSGRDAIGVWQVGVEAETRPRDVQALERRLALKERDGGVDAVLLLLSNTRHNRSLVRDHPSLRDRFSCTQRRTLDVLGAGARPEGGAIVLV
jgi:transcriptional regulator with XRE-family HTH domain